MLPRLQTGDLRPLSRQPIHVRRARASPGPRVVAVQAYPTSHTPPAFPSSLPLVSTPDAHSTSRQVALMSFAGEQQADIELYNTATPGVNPESTFRHEVKQSPAAQHRNGQGYIAFEKAVDRVLRRRGEWSVSIDETWSRLAAWVDKFYLDHDSTVFATQAAHGIANLAPRGSRSAAVKFFSPGGGRGGSCARLHHQ